jgi:hypothetical protein
MTASRSAVAFRWLIRDTALGGGDGEALQNVITSELPDGSSCYVISEESVYRLFKSSTTAANGVSIIAPVAGPGRWFKVQDDNAFMADPLAVFQAGTNVFPASSTDWFAPNTSNFTPDQAANFGTWTQGALGAFTYNGPGSLRWRLQLDATFAVGGATETVTAGISVNADLTGAADGQAQGAGTVVRTTTIVGRITVVRTRVLTPGDIVQPRIRNSASASTTASFLTLTAVPIQAP